MSRAGPPRVTIGLPVYNGAKFLRETLSTLLRQTYRDLELIISDNASTDGTETIARDCASQDPRVRYERLPQNVGPARNFNRLVAQARTPYFKWAAHDDLHDPEFLERCIAILEADPACVLAYTRALTIDSSGRQVKRAWGGSATLGSEEAFARFAQALAPPRDPIPLPIFGVIRTEVLRRVELLGPYPDCDRALVAELALHGPLREVPAPLFFQREHSGRAGNQLSRAPHAAPQVWSPNSSQWPPLPHWRLLRRTLRGVRRAHLQPWDRMRCHRAILSWLWRQRARLGRDLAAAGERAPLIGPAVTHLYRRAASRRWEAQTRRALREITAHVPSGARVLLADEGTFAVDRIGSRIVIPFLERNGLYWGAPPNDEVAICELERMRQEGATHLVVGWPAFWWLDYYEDFRSHIDRRFRRVGDSRRVVIYEME